MKVKFLIILLLLVLSFKNSFGLKFLNGFEDIPVFKEMEYVEDSLILFDKVEGRYVSSKISGDYDINEVQDYYKKILPNLGWQKFESNIYKRGKEILEIIFVKENQELSVIFSIYPGK